MPFFVSTILYILLLAVGALCVYGQVGLTYKDEKPDKLRKVAVVVSYFVMLAGLVLFRLIFLDDYHDRDSYNQEIKEARQESYDEGYSTGHDEGYNEGYESGLEDGWDYGYDEAVNELSSD